MFDTLFKTPEHVKPSLKKNKTKHIFVGDLNCMNRFYILNISDLYVFFFFFFCKDNWCIFLLQLPRGNNTGHLGVGGTKWHVEILYVRSLLIGRSEV